MNAHRDKILPVVVLYGRRLWDCPSYNSLVRGDAGGACFVFDNSPAAMHTHGEFGPGICYVHDGSNPGLSYAYNRAAEYARENGFEWILLLDQDTVFPAGIFTDYCRAADDNPDIKMVVPAVRMGSGRFMSPVKFSRGIAHPSVRVPVGRAPLKGYSAINSGMMIDVEAFFRVGGYNERVKLDFSDHQFVGRFKRHYAMFYVLPVECLQDFSADSSDAGQLLDRFALFCRSLKNYEKRGAAEKMEYFLVIVRRMLHLCWQTGGLKPVELFIKNYICK